MNWFNALTKKWGQASATKKPLSNRSRLTMESLSGRSLPSSVVPQTTSCQPTNYGCDSSDSDDHYEDNRPAAQ